MFILYLFIKNTLHKARFWTMLTIYRFLLSHFNFAKLVSKCHTIGMPLLISMPLTFFQLKKPYARTYQRMRGYAHGFISQSHAWKQEIVSMFVVVTNKMLK